MRCRTTLGWILFILFVATSADGLAQEAGGGRVVYGMFGPRVLGRR